MVAKGSPLVRSSEAPRLEVDDMSETSESQASVDSDSDRLRALAAGIKLRWRGDSAIRCCALIEDNRAPKGVGGRSLRNNVRGDRPDDFAILSGVSTSNTFRFPREEGTGDDCTTPGLALRIGNPFITGLFASRTSMPNKSSRARECNGWLGLGNRHG
jgi:hypothetical protein